MTIVNILAKLPNEIKERIDKPSPLRINNDDPGLYIPKEKSEEILEVLKETKDLLSDKKETVKNNTRIEIIGDMISIIEKDILNK